MNAAKHILVAPLDWGLGHAGRCIPVINDFLTQGHRVTVCGNAATNALIKSEFPDLNFEIIPSYNIVYSKGNSQILALTTQIPKINRAIKAEHLWLKNYCQNNKVDKIVSDNRYGFWHAKIHSTIITHQLFLQTPFRFLDFHQLIMRYLQPFNEILIPDFPTFPFLSGDLSHKKRLKTHRIRFIGPLSRFSLYALPNYQPIYDFIGIISGPSPHREMLFNELLTSSLKTNKKGIIIKGEPQQSYYEKIGNIEIYHHLETEKLLKKIMQSKQIISRSGYSTIMDLYSINRLKDARLIPTPGQYEQEYLYQFLKQNNFIND